MFDFSAESDICTFAQRTEHFRSVNQPAKCLFTQETRPKALIQLYETASAAAVRSLDSLRRERDAPSSLDMFVCTPILGKRAARKRDQSLDIESRLVSNHAITIIASYNSAMPRIAIHSSDSNFNYFAK